MNLEQTTEMPNGACHESINQTERNIALLVYGGSGVVSVVTSLVAVVLIILMKLYVQFTYRLALYQEFSSIFISLTQCVGLLQLNFPGHEQQTYDPFAACTASALLLQYALWVKLMFTIWLIFHLFVLAVFLKNLQRLELLYVFSSLLVPIIPTCIPLFTQAYGKDGARCWIKEKTLNSSNNCDVFYEGLIERYVLWYGPAVIALVIANLATLVMLYVMKRRAYAEVDPELTPLVKKNKQALKQMLPLTFYPVLFLVLMVVPLITRIISDAIGTYDHFPLALLHGIAYPPGGFFSGLVVIIHLCVLHSQRKKKSALKDAKPRLPPPPPVNAPAPASKKPSFSKFSFLV